MEIQWIGNTSFLIKNSTGKRIFLDPIQLSSTNKKYDLKSDIITFSHTHYDETINNYVDSDCKIINSPCEFINTYLNIKGFKSYKDNLCGLKRGENIIYLIEIDNFRICHLGSLGHMLDKTLIDKLSDIDILFIPVGGHICLDGIVASKLSLMLKPKYIIPMSFKTSSDYFYLDGPHKFISSMQNVCCLNDCKFNTNQFEFNTSNSVLLLNTTL